MDRDGKEINDGLSICLEDEKGGTGVGDIEDKRAGWRVDKGDRGHAGRDGWAGDVHGDGNGWSVVADCETIGGTLKIWLKTIFRIKF